MRYCAVCDHKYVAGTFKQHVKGFAHQAELKARKMMAEWYRVNGV